MSKWYTDKIKAVAPELLDGDKYDVLEHITSRTANSMMRGKDGLAAFCVRMRGKLKK